jgi:hypothetical protein
LLYKPLNLSEQAVGFAEDWPNYRAISPADAFCGESF